MQPKKASFVPCGDFAGVKTGRGRFSRPAEGLNASREKSCSGRTGDRERGRNMVLPCWNKGKCTANSSVVAAAAFAGVVALLVAVVIALLAVHHHALAPLAAAAPVVLAEGAVTIAVHALDDVSHRLLVFI